MMPGLQIAAVLVIVGTFVTRISTDSISTENYLSTSTITNPASKASMAQLNTIVSESASSDYTVTLTTSTQKLAISTDSSSLPNAITQTTVVKETLVTSTATRASSIHSSSIQTFYPAFSSTVHSLLVMPENSSSPIMAKETSSIHQLAVISANTLTPTSTSQITMVPTQSFNIGKSTFITLVTNTASVNTTQLSVFILTTTVTLIPESSVTIMNGTGKLKTEVSTSSISPPMISNTKIIKSVTSTLMTKVTAFDVASTTILTEKVVNSTSIVGIVKTAVTSSKLNSGTSTTVNGMVQNATVTTSLVNGMINSSIMSTLVIDMVTSTTVNSLVNATVTPTPVNGMVNSTIMSTLVHGLVTPTPASGMVNATVTSTPVNGMVNSTVISIPVVVTSTTVKAMVNPTVTSTPVNGMVNSTVISIPVVVTSTTVKAMVNPTVTSTPVNGMVNSTVTSIPENGVLTPTTVKAMINPTVTSNPVNEMANRTRTLIVMVNSTVTSTRSIMTTPITSVTLISAVVLVNSTVASFAIEYTTVGSGIAVTTSVLSKVNSSVKLSLSRRINSSLTSDLRTPSLSLSAMTSHSFILVSTTSSFIPPYPSSSTTISPETTFQQYRISFEEDCQEVQNVTSDAFKTAVITSIHKNLKIDTSRITILNVFCVGSINVDFKIKNAKKDNITKRLAEAVDKKQLMIKYNGESLQVILVLTINTKTTDHDDTALIIYIVLGTVMGVAFIIAVVALVTRCRRERSEGMFHLPDEEHLELSGFSRDPKSNFHRGNFYGDLEMDSGEPRSPDPEISSYGDETMNGGTVVGHLPEWKNLPSIDLSEAMHVEDESVNGNLILMYGEKNNEKENMANPNDSVRSYDNPSVIKENETDQ